MTSNRFISSIFCESSPINAFQASLGTTYGLIILAGILFPGLSTGLGLNESTVCWFPQTFPYGYSRTGNGISPMGVELPVSRALSKAFPTTSTPC